MNVIDTHCHLDLIEEKGYDAAAVLLKAKAAGVSHVLQIATEYRSSLYNYNLSKLLADKKNIPEFYWAAGKHPESADDGSDVNSVLQFIKDHREDKGFVAIGETGLDAFHSTKHFQEQKEYFEMHLKLAAELALPVLLHLRDDRAYNPAKLEAFQTALSLVEKYKNVRGVLHCFTYSYEEAKPFVDMGWFVSYSGIITYKNAGVLKDGAVKLPLSSLLVETDAPFLTPEPHRGKMNEPCFVGYVADCIAALRRESCGEEESKVKDAIYKNSLELLSLKK